MPLIDLVIIPIAFGLIGFVEPCVVGMNAIFLSYLRGRDRMERVVETSKFAIVKGLFLAFLGLLGALIGKGVFSFQDSYSRILGAFFVLMGAIYIISKFRPLPVPNMTPLRRERAPSIGVYFGFSLPACAVPLFLALFLRSIFVGDAAFGFFSLFLFGLALSLPLSAMSLSQEADELMKGVGRMVHVAPYLGGVALILVGAYMIL